MGRLVTKPVLGVLLLRDIGERARDAERSPAGTMSHFAAGEHPEIASVLMGEAMLAFEEAALAGFRRPEPLAHSRAIVGMDAVEPLGRGG